MAEVKVRITDESGTNEVNIGGGGGGTNPHTNLPKTNPQENKASKTTSKSLAIASMFAKSAFSQVTSNVGKFTGNSHNQAVVNNLTDIGSTALLAVVNPYVAIAKVGIQVGTAAITNYFEEKEQQRTARIRQARMGYTNTGQMLGYRR